MKSTGILRKVDELGRLVLPVELRKNLKIEQKDAIEIFVENDQIILKKYESKDSCAITGEISNLNQKISGITLSPDGANILLEAIKLNFGGNK